MPSTGCLGCFWLFSLEAHIIFFLCQTFGFRYSVATSCRCLPTMFLFHPNILLKQMRNELEVLYYVCNYPERLILDCAHTPVVSSHVAKCLYKDGCLVRECLGSCPSSFTCSMLVSMQLELPHLQFFHLENGDNNWNYHIGLLWVSSVKYRTFNTVYSKHSVSTC